MAVMDPRDMENKLLAHSQQHFSQAHGTAYTEAPPQELLQYNGLAEFGNKVTHSEISRELNIPPVT